VDVLVDCDLEESQCFRAVAYQHVVGLVVVIEHYLVGFSRTQRTYLGGTHDSLSFNRTAVQSKPHANAISGAVTEIRRGPKSRCTGCGSPHVRKPVPLRLLAPTAIQHSSLSLPQALKCHIDDTCHCLLDTATLRRFKVLQREGRNMAGEPNNLRRYRQLRA